MDCVQQQDTKFAFLEIVEMAECGEEDAIAGSRLVYPGNRFLVFHSLSPTHGHDLSGLGQGQYLVE